MTSAAGRLAFNQRDPEAVPGVTDKRRVIDVQNKDAHTIPSLADNTDVGIRKLLDVMFV